MSVRILHGDCRQVMRALAEASVDSIVTDPPYHLTNGGGGPHGKGIDNPYSRSRAGATSTGFMGMAWDGGDVAFRVETWAEALRVLKPGGHLLAFSGTRTYHRMVVAIEDAGFEIRDQLGWIYGSGFPKSKNLAGDWLGWGTALKPAWEPIVLARKPLCGTVAANVQEYGTGALNIDGCRIEGVKGVPASPARKTSGNALSGSVDGSLRNCTGEEGGFNPNVGRWPANILHDGSDEVVAAFPLAPGQQADQSSSSSRKNQTVYGAMKRGNGRDGEPSADSDNAGAVGFKMKPGMRRGDIGTAARFFYCAKADRADRNEGLQDPGQQFIAGRMPHDAEAVERAKRGNHHPTVKPTDLMRWLCRLITPPGGLVLDPFMGSGSTLKAAELEGFSAIGIELDPAYIEIAKRRIAADAPLFAEVSTA